MICGVWMYACASSLVPPSAVPWLAALQENSTEQTATSARLAEIRFIVPLHPITTVTLRGIVGRVVSLLYTAHALSLNKEADKCAFDSMALLFYPWCRRRRSHSLRSKAGRNQSVVNQRAGWHTPDFSARRSAYRVHDLIPDGDLRVDAERVPAL